MLHNSYQYRGGEDESYESEVRMLRAEGHSVETIHVNNSGIESKGKFQVALESLWSSPSYDLVDRKLSECSFDVLHVQNFFPQLSPSGLLRGQKAWRRCGANAEKLSPSVPRRILLSRWPRLRGLHGQGRQISRASCTVVIAAAGSPLRRLRP